jgi:hypothetical protein
MGTSLGAGYPHTVAYFIARAHALSGEKEAALKRLDQALELGFRSRERVRNDEAFAPLRDDPTFKTLAGVVDTARMSRAEGWRHDILFLEGEVKRMHHAPFRRVPRAEFETDLRRLREELPELTDHQVIVRLMGALRKIGDGHTGIFPNLIRAWDHTVPLQFGLFPEGPFVIAAAPHHADLVGARVLRLGDHTPERVLESLATVISQDNAQGVVRAAPSHMRYPQVLNGLGLQSETDGIRLTVRPPDGGQKAVTVKATRTDPEFNRIIGHPKWPAVHTNAPGPVSTYLKDRGVPYRFEQLDDKTVYFQFNSVTKDPADPLDRFAGRLFRHIEANGVRKLVIDLRWNNGGNTLLLPPLVRELVRARAVNRRGHLFVITGRYTFSAGMNAAAYIERDTEAIFVGEPTPSSPNHVGESNIMTLPYSGVRVSISDLYWQGSWPTDHRTWIAPLVHAPPSFEAYKAGRDPAMEAVLAYPPGDPPPPGNPSPVAGKAEEEVKKLEREWLDAYEKNDAAAVDRIVAGDFTITFPDGSVQTKAQVVEGVKRPRKDGQPGPKSSPRT